MTFLRSKTIRSGLLRALTVVLTGLVVTSAIVWEFNIEPALRMGVAKRQQEVARRAADQIQQFIEERTWGLIAAAEIGHFWEASKEHQKQALHHLLKLDRQINEISVLDASGQEIIRLSRLRVYTDADLTSLASEEKFRQAIQGKVYISPPYHARTAEPFITLAVPVKFTAREIKGILIAEVSLKGLWDAISYIKVGKSGHAFVVDHKGNLIAHPDYSKILLGTNMGHLHKVKEFLTDPGHDPDFGEGVIGQDGKKVISTFVRVEGLDWAVFVEERIETALAEVKRVEKLAVLLFVLMVVGAFAVSYFFSERISRPVRELEQGVRLIGEGNLEHKLAIRTGDEIEALGDQFNRMAQALKESYQGLEGKIAERTKEISALYFALAPLAPADSVEQMLERVIQRIMVVTGADASLFRIKEQITGAFICPAQIGFPSEYLEATERLQEGSALELAFRTGEPVISSNIAEDPRIKGKRHLEAGFNSCAFLPLKVADEVRGVIQLASRELGHFNEEKKDQLMAIARHMGVAIENRELFQQTHQNLERIRAQREIEMAVTSTLDLYALLELLLEKIDLIRPHSVATVRLLNRQTGRLEPVACRNIDETEWKVGTVGTAETVSDMLPQGNSPVIVRDAQRNPCSLNPHFLRKHGLTSYVRVALVAKDDILGVLTIFTREEHEFSNQEVDFLTSIGGQAAIAIHNSQLYEEMAKLAGDLAKSNRVKDEFLSVMSHELRTPLNVVMGYAAMIKDGLLGEINTEQEKAAEKIITRAKDQLIMISEILQVTQIEAEGIKLMSHEFSLEAFLNDLRSTYDVSMDKEITLTWDYHSDLPVIKTDGEKLKHILQNLINNAIKFTGQGHVTISAGLNRRSRQQPESNGQVEFKVEDTGIGIPEEALPIIFERFRQLDSSETRNHGGVGMGLYIVKKYTEVLGGSVQVESEPGKGSTFTVTIPLTATQQQESADALV